MPLKYAKGGVVLLTDFKIKNFKAFDDFDLQNLKKVNIFVGKPNTGKTSILEALSLFLARNPQMLISLLDERSMVGDNTCFESLFFDYRTDSAIVLETNLASLKISPNFQSQSLVISERTASIDILDSYYLTKNLKNLKFSF